MVVNDAPAMFAGPCEGAGGVTTVTWTATDASGNEAQCSANVTVVDTTPPEIEVTVEPQALWPPNHKMVDVEYTVTVSDICDDDVTWVLVSVTSNEPDNNGGDGDTDDDIQGDDLGTPDTYGPRLHGHLHGHRLLGQFGRNHGQRLCAALEE